MSSSRAGTFLTLVTVITVAGITYVHSSQVWEREVREHRGVVWIGYTHGTSADTAFPCVGAVQGRS